MVETVLMNPNHPFGEHWGQVEGLGAAGSLWLRAVHPATERRASGDHDTPGLTEDREQGPGPPLLTLTQSRLAFLPPPLQLPGPWLRGQV